jgi:hypothetical protein
MNPNQELSDPQARLLLKLFAKPAPISPSYRPLQTLVEKDLVRARHVGAFGSNPTYECSPTGLTLAQQMKERMAANDKACTCGREWSLKHAPQCPVAGSGFAAPSSVG